LSNLKFVAYSLCDDASTVVYVRTLAYLWHETGDIQYRRRTQAFIVEERQPLSTGQVANYAVNLVVQSHVINIVS